LESTNKYVGIFACDSVEYASWLINGPAILAMDSLGGSKPTTTAGGLARAAFVTISSLIGGATPSKAASVGTNSLLWIVRPVYSKIDRGDKVVVR